MSNARLANGANQGAICDRCRMSYKRKELQKDPNAPGLRVCHDCRDQYNPYRLPPRTMDPIAMAWIRPYPELVAPVEDWFAPGLVAPYQPVGPNDPPYPQPRGNSVCIESKPCKPRLTEDQMQEDYMPNRLKCR